MWDTSSINLDTSQDLEGSIHSSKLMDSNHILFNGLDEYSNPLDTLPSNHGSEPSNVLKCESTNHIEPSDSASQSHNPMYDTLNYEIEDVFSTAFNNLGSSFPNGIAANYPPSTNSSMLDRNIKNTKRNEFDKVNEPTNSFIKSNTFKPFKTQLNTFGSSVIFPNIKTLRTNFNDICLSHSQDFEDSGDSYIIRNEFPGHKKADISVNVNGSYLEITAGSNTSGNTVQGNLHTTARSAMSYSSTLTIPPGVIKNSITAKFRDGLLTVTLPKRTNSISNNF